MTIFGTLWPKQNNPVMLLRHNGENKHLATPLSMYFLDMLVMDHFQIYFTQNHYFCFYFLTLAFYFVPSLDSRGRDTISRASRERGHTLVVSEGQRAHEECRRNFTNNHSIQSYLRRKQETESAAGFSTGPALTKSTL